MISRRTRAARLGERLMARAVMHVGDEMRVYQTFQRTIDRSEPDAPRNLLADAVEQAIHQANKRIADNLSENQESAAGIARLKRFKHLHRSGT